MVKKILKREWVVLLLIIAVSVSFNQFLLENVDIKISLLQKNFYELLMITIIGCIGFYGLQNFENKWINNIWIICYSISLISIISFLVYDSFFYKNLRVDGQFRFGTIKQFLSYPLLYILCILMHLRALKSVGKSHTNI